MAYSVSGASLSGTALASNTSADGSIHVEYFEKPYRYYELNGQKVPSVTQAIGVVDKSAPLQHYASNETLKGIAALAMEMRGRLPFPAAWAPLAAGESEQSRIELIGNLLKGSLRKRKLMFYDATNRAATRGVAVHDVFEQWAERQAIPNLSDFPVEQRGFVQGLGKWIMTARPEVLSTEEVVGSAKYGYAGRLDMTVLTRVGGKARLTDIKTSKACYPRQHFPQLEAYENARAEMGGEPVEEKSILLLTATGDFREVLSRDVEFEDFRVLLAAHRSQSAIPECAECWEVRCKCRRKR